MKREQEYDVERGTCRALINYLKNLTPASGTPECVNNSGCVMCPSLSVESSAEGTPEGASAGAVQTSPPTKRAEEEWVPSGGRRKSKRDKKKSSTKVEHLKDTITLLNVSCCRFNTDTFSSTRPPCTSSCS